MKKLFTALLITITVSACNKCYECQSPAPQWPDEDICQSDIEKGTKVSDIVREFEEIGYRCSKKQRERTVFCSDQFVVFARVQSVFRLGDKKIG